MATTGNEAVQEELWDYYRQLRRYQDKPLETEAAIAGAL